MIHMAKKKIAKSTKRFGPRYGRTVKDKLAKVERQAKATYQCPYCLKKKVKKVMAGIWECKTCGKKFTDKAYRVTKRRKKVEQ